MIPIDRLRRAVKEALDYVRTLPDVREVEAFASANGTLISRLNYTSHIPSNGVEEPKSTESYGIGLYVAFETPEGAARIGYGSEPSSLGLEAVQTALEKARRGAVPDPDFVSFPQPTGERRTLRRYHDPQLMVLKDDALVEAGWRVAEQALEAFRSSEELAIAAGKDGDITRMGLILGGDVTVLQERVAIASTWIPQPQMDESTLIMSFVTSMVERDGAKGTAWSTGTRLEEFDGRAGWEAARAAITGMNAVRVPTGEYRVVFGPQAVADLWNHIVMPSLSLDSMFAQVSAFGGKLGKRIASPHLTLIDDGAAPGLMGSKGITDEGLPTGRTVLVKDGVLVGLLANWYESQRILRDREGKKKLGADPAANRAAFTPRNGFRFSPGGGRHFARAAGPYATNVIFETSSPRSREGLLGEVGDGLYIGRLWYTYPINGLAAGDFTCTVIGDSFLIREGKLAEPVRPNTLRINESIHAVLNNILGMTAEGRGTMVWASDEVIHAPEIAASGVHVTEIAQSLGQGG
jgi:predicted Zn-dependent protease